MVYWITISVILSQNGNEDGGCNYFKWWTEDAIEEIGNNENCEGRGEIVVKTEESDGDRKTITNLEKSIAIFEKWMKLLIGMVIFVCVVNVIVLSVLIKNAWLVVVVSLSGYN